MPRIPSELSPTFSVTREPRAVNVRKAIWPRGFVLGVLATFVIAYTMADFIAYRFPFLHLR